MILLKKSRRHRHIWKNRETNIKKNILVILASPRKGNSTYAAEKFAKSLKGKKTYVDINRLEIKPCKACDKCGKKLMCVYDDDAAALIRQVEGSDVVIVASPVFFTGVPGPLKIFIDRNQVKWEEFYSTEYQVPGTEKEPNRKPDKGMNLIPDTRYPIPKTGIIILTAGHNKAKYFRPAESEIRSFFAVNNIKTKLVMKFGNMDEKYAMKKYAAKIKAAARKPGKNG